MEFWLVGRAPKLVRSTAAIALSALLLWVGACDAGGERGAPISTFRVLAAYPHDPTAFTQGLIYRNGYLIEGTGLRGRSTLRKVKLDTGEVEVLRRLPERYFGEGIAALEGRLYQLTWQAGEGFSYDAEDLRVVGNFSYEGEGWGLTDDGRQLIMSDGSATLSFRDPVSFELTREVLVTDAGEPVTRLNELEYVKGEVWANVWQTDRIARIDPASGEVVGWIDLSGLRVSGDGDVLNGIAYDAEGDRIFVTGKLWSKVYQIEVVDQ